MDTSRRRASTLSIVLGVPTMLTDGIHAAIRYIAVKNAEIEPKVRYAIHPRKQIINYHLCLQMIMILTLNFY